MRHNHIFELTFFVFDKLYYYSPYYKGIKQQFLNNQIDTTPQEKDIYLRYFDYPLWYRGTFVVVVV